MTLPTPRLPDGEPFFPKRATGGVLRFIHGTAQSTDTSPIDTARLEKAIRFSSFNELQKQEQSHGFRERMSSAQSFFREGKIGAWRNQLSHEQVQRIIHDHAEVMQRFGYLSASGEVSDFTS